MWRVSWFQVPLPEKPELDDIEELRNWRRQFASAKRINSERHSLRCDTELKLMVNHPRISLVLC